MKVISFDSPPSRGNATATPPNNLPDNVAGHEELISLVRAGDNHGDKFFSELLASTRTGPDLNPVIVFLVPILLL